MNRISTFTQFFSSSNGISDGQKNMGRAQEQTASGKVANDVKGFGDDAGRLLSAKSYGDRLDTRAETLKGLQSRAEIEATALEQGTAAITSVKQSIMNAIANQNGAGLRAAMEQALSIVGTSANVQYNGQAVFGGEWGVGDPFIPASLDALALQPNTDPNWVDTGRNRTVMIEDNRAIELSGSAKELFKPFVDFLRDVRVWENANGAFQNKLSNAQQTYLQSLVPGFSAIETTAIDKAASAGSTAKQLELAMDFNAMQRDAFNKTIGDQENVNLAEVAARLSAAQTQYQASAAIFGRLKDMNLLQYLR